MLLLSQADSTDNRKDSESFGGVAACHKKCATGPYHPKREVRTQRINYKSNSLFLLVRCPIPVGAHWMWVCMWFLHLLSVQMQHDLTSHYLTHTYYRFEKPQLFCGITIHLLSCAKRPQSWSYHGYLALRPDTGGFHWGIGGAGLLVLPQ